MANYAKVGELSLHLLNVGGDGCAFDKARAFYSKHSSLNFEADFIDYCRNGYVVCRPDLLGFVKPHEFPQGTKPWSGQRAWHIQFAIGNLAELVMTLPCKLKWLTWCRNNETDKMRIVRTDALLRRAFALANRKAI